MLSNQLFRTWFLATVALLMVLPSFAIAVTPQIEYPAARDLNSNRIDDALDARVADVISSADPAEPIRVIVTLFSRPSNDEIAAFRDLGGKVVHRYEHATYGFSGTIPANRVAEVAVRLDRSFCIIELDMPGSGTLDDSARQIRARPLVWNATTGYGLEGLSSTSIAIFDSGIDTTHTDLSGGRLVFWHDFTSEGKATSTDQNMHGTHVAGIAGGTGAALGSGVISTITTTFSGRLPATNGWGYATMIKVPVLGSGQVTSNLLWSGSGTGAINLATSVPGWLGSYSSSSPPLSHTWTITSTDMYKARAGNGSGLGNRSFSMLTTHPYTSVGDGFNLFQGVAKGCRLAGVKILDQTSSGWASDWTEAFDSLAAVNYLHNVKVANASVGLNSGGTNAALRIAVNGLVAAGTVVCISAGNDYGSFNIADPALADKCIAVGAINDFSAMTDYSSNGAGGSGKPDVVAPGGSHSWSSNVGSQLTSTDTNINDAWASMFSDRQANDYTNLHGTSMAAPHVAGTAALIIQAMEEKGNAWGYSEYEALKVKSLILMTATETNKLGEESCGNNPPLNRGAPDLVEGYGKINVDAAVEAVTGWIVCPPDTAISVTLGSGDFDRKCWATEIGLCGPDTQVVTLNVPATADYDLYLYSPYHTSIGRPQIQTSSTNAGLGVDEEVRYVQGMTCWSGYLVVKWVSGSGTATFDVEARSTGTGIATNHRVPGLPVLKQNYPNPFNVITTIPYRVTGMGTQSATLKIYNTRGALVRTLVDAPVRVGDHMEVWNGRDNNGRAVASGVYFARLEVMGLVKTRRITLVR